MPEKRVRKEVPLEAADKNCIAVEGDLNENDPHLAPMRSDAVSLNPADAALGMCCVRKPIEMGNWATTRDKKAKSFYTDVVYNAKVKQAIEEMGFNVINPWDSAVTDKLFAFFDSWYDSDGMDATKFQQMMQANKNVSIAALFKPNPVGKEGKVGRHIYTHPHGNAGADTSKVRRCNLQCVLPQQTVSPR